jgi:bifunctional DNA-binding transcriptional regulator/antitoxin component of YhaV-PrlF toxin-antitoxin module
MDKQIGIIKEFDALGRLVIPKEMRQLFDFNKKVEIIITEDGLLLRKPKYKLVEINCEKHQ